MSASEHFEVLRDILQAPRLSAATWPSVCWALSAFPPGEELDVAVRYVNDHTHRWPIALRVAPQPWIEAGLYEGRDEVRLRVVRVLDLSSTGGQGWSLRRPNLAGEHATSLPALRPEVLARLAQSPHLGWLHTLDLSNNGLGPRGLEPLLGAEGLPRLYSLDLRRNLLGVGALELLQAPLVASLRELHLPNAPPEIASEVREVLSDRRRLPHLLRWSVGGEGAR